MKGKVVILKKLWGRS